MDLYRHMSMRPTKNVSKAKLFLTYKLMAGTFG